MSFPTRRIAGHLACASVLAILTWVSNPATAFAAPAMTGPCTNAGGITQLCSFTNPEDLASVPKTPWVIVSQMAAQGDESGFAAIDTNGLRIVKINTSDIDTARLDKSAGCLGQPHHFKLGGIGILRDGDHNRLDAIEHQDNGRDAVEFFDVSITNHAPKLAWVGCVMAPEPLFLNDMAALPHGAFATTHMFDRSVAAKDRAQQRQRYLAGENTGFVETWSPTGGWRQIPGSEGSFPNGIDADPDGKTVYMAETYGHRVNAIKVDGSGRRSVALHMQPDNVTFLSHDRVIVAGGTGAPVTSTEGCPKLEAQGCGFPSEVDEVDFRTKAVKTLFSDTGKRVPGASTGLVVNNKLLIGTSFGNRVTVVPLRQGRP